MDTLVNLPIKIVLPSELEALCSDPKNPQHKTQIYVTVLEAEHMCESINGENFNKKDYYENPQNYKPIFHEKYLQYISVIFHNMYWD